MAGSDYYNHTTYPQVGAPGSSSALRSELDAIEAGFDKLPALQIADANKYVKLNPTATALMVSAVISDDGTNATVSGDLTVAGGNLGPDADSLHTIPNVAADTFTLNGATQTLTGKTISVDNNTVSGIAASSFVLSNGSGNIDGAAAQKAIPTGAVVGTSDTQTLTSKTLTSPRIGTSILDTNGNELFLLTATASAVNELTYANAATGNAPAFTASGGDANISINLVPKGTGTVQAGGVDVVTTTGTQTLTGKTVNLTSNTLTGTLAQFNTAVSDADLASLAGTETLTNKTLTSPRVGTSILDTNGNELFLLTATASAVNELTYANAATGGAPTFTASGGDANIGINLVPKGTGTLRANNVDVVTTSGTQTLTNKTLTSPRVGTSILDTNGNELFLVTATASAVNELTYANAATGGAPTFTASGGDANISINLVPKGTGTVRANNVDVVTTTGTQTLTNKTLTSPTLRFADLGFIADSNGNELVIFDLNASAVNEITVANAATGNRPTISATGGDTNISLNLVSKGTGTVQANGNTVATLESGQSWTGSQRGTVTTDNDLSFDMNVSNNFACTPTAGGTLTFTNITAGQSGFILFTNSSNYTISLAATTKADASFAGTISTTGTYLISYFSNGTNVYCTTTGALV